MQRLGHCSFRDWKSRYVGPASGKQFRARNDSDATLGLLSYGPFVAQTTD